MTFFDWKGNCNINTININSKLFMISITKTISILSMKAWLLANGCFDWKGNCNINTINININSKLFMISITKTKSILSMKAWILANGCFDWKGNCNKLNFPTQHRARGGWMQVIKLKKEMYWWQNRNVTDFFDIFLTLER